MKRFLLHICIAAGLGVGVGARAQTFTQVGSPGPSYGTLTNIALTPPGRPRSFNLDKFRYMHRGMYKGTAFKALIITDLSGFPDTHILTAFESLIGKTGGLSGYGAAEGNPAITTNGTVRTDFDTTAWFENGGLLYALTNASSLVTWSRRGTGGAVAVGGITDTNFLATTGTVYYVAAPGFGTFKLQTNLNGGGWNDFTAVGTVNTANAQKQNIAINFSLPNTYCSIRAVGVTVSTTSPVQILPTGGYWNDATNSLCYGVMALNNAGAANIVTTATTNCTWPVFNAMRPDVIFYLDTTGALTPTLFPALEYMWTNCCPNAVVCYMGNHDNGGLDGSYNIQAITNAFIYQRPFFDTAFYLGTNQTWLIANGFLAADGIHLETNGIAWLGGALWSSMGMPAPAMSPGFYDPAFAAQGSAQLRVRGTASFARPVTNEYVTATTFNYFDGGKSQQSIDPNGATAISLSLSGFFYCLGATAGMNMQGRNGSGQVVEYSPDGHTWNWRDQGGGAEMIQFSNNLAGVTWFQPGGAQPTLFGSSLRPWSSGWFTNDVGFRYPILTKTSNYTIVGTDQIGAEFNNNGAGGTQTNTLPAATAGLHYGFTQVTAQNITVRAAGTDTIRNVGQVSGAGGGVFVNTVGAHINIFCPVAGQWFITSTNTPLTSF